MYELKDNDRAKEYTNDIHIMLNELNQKYYTSNRVLNVILNDKFLSIKNAEIKLDYKIGDVNLDFIREIDVTTIFANLLDNSIEAASKVETNRFINFYVNQFNDFVVINMKGLVLKMLEKH